MHMKAMLLFLLQATKISSSSFLLPADCNVKMKKINTLLRKCMSIGTLGRSSSHSSLRSKSTKEDLWEDLAAAGDHEDVAVVLVGRSRRRYLVKSKHLSHPLLTALMDPSTSTHGAGAGASAADGSKVISVRCEVVLFDHLLWMLENTQLEVADHDGATLQELAELYAC